MTYQPATRPSTLAKAMDDATGLFPYIGARTLMVVRDNPDLLTRLSLTNGDWRAFKDLYLEADQRGGGREASAGTNVHMVVQAMAQGYDVSSVPEPALSDGMAAWEFIQDQGWDVVHSEVFVVTEGLNELCAGTADLVLETGDGIRFIGDLKTVGTVGDAKYKSLSWSIQTAIYARGKPYPEDPKRDRWGRPLIDLAKVGRWDGKAPRTDASVVLEIHRGNASVRDIWLDLEKGWEHAKRCVAIRAARKSAGSLVLPDGPLWLDS